MNAECTCRVDQMSAVLLERFFDVDLFEFTYRLGKQDPSVEHLLDESFHSFSHLIDGGGELELIRQILSSQ